MEADTLFLPDLTSPSTINAGGGWLAGPAPQSQEQISRNFQFGPGKFGAAIRGKPGNESNFVFFPLDGLVPADEWTTQFWAKADRSWTGVNGTVFALVGGQTNSLHLYAGGGKCGVDVATYQTNPGPGSYQGNWERPCETLGLTAGRWHAFAFTFKDATLTIYVDGRLTGTINNVKWRPLWTDDTAANGVQIGGRPNSSVWVSDVRIARTARIPGRPVALRSLQGSVVIDAHAVTGSVSPHLLGALHPDYGNATSEQVRAALQTIRTTDFLTATPIKRGGTDKHHPSLGISGKFAYDWQVVDRTLDWMKARGVAPYISLDASPQILGGSVGPFVPGGRPPSYIGNLDRDMVNYSYYSPRVPDSLSDLSTLVRDLAHHILVQRRQQVAYWSVGNEPDLPDFWQGTKSQYYDTYAAAVKAVRAVDRSARVGGPEISSFDLSSGWIDGLLARAARQHLPVDFIAYHEYSGDIANIDRVRRTVDRYAALHGFPKPLPVVMGEFNWSPANTFMIGSSYLWQTDQWPVRSFGAAYTIASLIHATELPAVPVLVYSHLSYGQPRIDGKRGLDTSPRRGGFASDQLIGPDGMQWAPYNALKGFKGVVGREILAGSQQLPPGIYSLSTKDPATGRLGLVFANYGWAQRQSRTVKVTVKNLASGSYRLQRWLVDQSHSSRWDAAQDRPEGALHDGLERVEDRALRVSRIATFSLDLPPWSATFVSLGKD